MVVAVLVGLAERREALAAVLGEVHPDVHLVDPVELVRRGVDLLVVVRPGAVGEVVAALLPALAAVLGAVEAALLVVGLDRRVDHVGIDRRDRQPDLAHVARRQPGGQAAPGGAAVHRLVDAGASAAGQQRPDVATALVGGGVQHVGIARVELEIGDAGVGAEVEHPLPAGAAVARSGRRRARRRPTTAVPRRRPGPRPSRAGRPGSCRCARSCRAPCGSSSPPPSLDL